MTSPGSTLSLGLDASGYLEEENWKTWVLGLDTEREMKHGTQISGNKSEYSKLGEPQFLYIAFGANRNTHA